MQRPLCFVCALSDTPSTPKIVALIQQPVGFQSVRTGFAQKCSRCYRIDLAAIGVLVVNPPVKWGFVLERQSWGPSQNANDGWAGEQRQGLVMKKSQQFLTELLVSLHIKLSLESEFLAMQQAQREATPLVDL